MSVVEAIYLVAAVLWILVVVTAACVAGHYLVKLRARRRQVTGLFDAVRLSIERATHPYRAVAAGGAAVVQRVVSASNVFASVAQLMISSSPSARSAASRSRHS
ncbi:hypothetical protein AWC02_01530 [Mycolicibacter engbaekii]|uniref:Uncharacterized protein n=1 Tax=Mycolicibacter engbaekii TaxID=188915 RepID=A0A1X1UAE8_9MYCO|nr:hypothetical protein [Mycolicibacter engbaekii]ORV53795.1 hypothetical protein AWC02_01530 [Mycolicibacter engbaekii]